jgi:hypothetical protein
MTLDIRHMLKNIFLLKLKCKHMALAIDMLDNISLLHTKRRLIISSSPMCNGKHHIINNVPLRRITLC